MQETIKYLSDRAVCFFCSAGVPAVFPAAVVLMIGIFAGIYYAGT